MDRWPDEENRNSPDIDAIAGPFAIEHTSIDTLPKQRRDEDWFMRVVGGLEKELPCTPRFRLRITLDYKAIIQGQDWTVIRAGIKTWLTNEVPLLTDGHHILDGIRGVPFKLHVIKKSDRPAGIFFDRSEPGDDTLPARIREQFDRKAKKLAKYHDKTKILLIESDDIALMSEIKMFSAIREAYPVSFPSGIDQIWYADTSIPSEIGLSECLAIADIGVLGT